MAKKYEKGIVRSIDPLGRLVIPKEIRNELGLLKDEPVEMKVEGNQVIISKYKANCIICGGTQDSEMLKIHDKKICNKCQDLIKKY